MPWSSSLTLVLLMPDDDREGVVDRVDGDDRELVGLEADDHVHVVAGLDDRADAGDLVDLDRHAALGRRAVDLSRVPTCAAGQGPGRDRPRRWRRSGGRSGRRPGRRRRRRPCPGRRSGSAWTVTWSAAMRVPSGMSVVAMTVGSSVGARSACRSGLSPRRGSRMPTNATIARKTPTSRTNRFERFKFSLPRGLMCDRWHHCSTAQNARDYTNGLGPSSRKRQDSARVARLRARSARDGIRGYQTRRDRHMTTARRIASPAGRRDVPSGIGLRRHAIRGRFR